MEITQETKNIDISDTVAEITNVISKHLTKVIEKVSSKNNDASQNMEILNQLPIVKNMRRENDALQQQFNELQDKYKSCLEELIQFKSKEKITMEAKDGGLMNLGGKEMDLRGGGFVPIGKKERADDVPARLSKNEFVMTADAVRAAGGGSVNKGAKRMYNLMNTLEARA